MKKDSKTNQRELFHTFTQFAFYISIICVISGCATQKPTTKMSGKLTKLSEDFLVAILPVEFSDSNQKEAAELFRQSLYANFKRSRFKLIERFVVDGLLEQNKIKHPKQLKKISAIRLGEILGADAVLHPVMSKVERSYAVIHSSIELTASVTLTDTRTGEILWKASQTETDFEGIGKLPTGIFAAAIAPVELVTNKFNLNKIIHKLTEKLTSLIEKPESVQKGEFFNSPQIAKDSARDIEEIASSSTQPTLKQKTKLVITEKAKKKEPKIESPIFKVVKSFIYTLQVGAYKTKSYAQKMIKTLAEKGYSAFITPSQKDQHILYKVNVEKFKNKEQAGKFAEQFSMRENLDHFVIRMEPPNPS